MTTPTGTATVMALEIWKKAQMLIMCTLGSMTTIMTTCTQMARITLVDQYLSNL